MGRFKRSILKGWGSKTMAAVKFKASYGIVLRLLGPDGDLDRLVSPMSASIRSSIARIDKAARGDNEMVANEKHTATVIQAFGAQPGSTGNLRQGYRGLFGDDDYANLGRLAGAMEHWTRAVRKAYENELRNAGLF
jgi:hypothetical protein